MKGGKESFSGGVQWRHTEGGDEILLLSPLGQALAQIQAHSRRGASDYLRAGKLLCFRCGKPDRTGAGVALPLMGLQYWVQSINSPSTASAIDLDNEGRVVAIRQDGWEIIYSSYFPDELVQAASSQAARAETIACSSAAVFK